jgi:hypothetical protein
MLERFVPLEVGERERLVSLLLGPRPSRSRSPTGALCLGQWQRILLVGFESRCTDEWMVTIVA